MLWELALLLSTALAQGCLRYICDPPGMMWPSLVCGMKMPYNASEFALNTTACHGGEYCALNDWNQVPATCHPASQTYSQALPGEPCNAQHTCMYSQCVNSTCSYTAPFQSCQSTWECGIDHTCFGGVCYPLSKVGGECAMDTDCVQNAGCDKAKGSGSGVCVEYLSIPPHQSVKHCSKYWQLSRNDLCASMLCYYINAEESFCADYVKSQTQLPVVSSSYWCTSTPDSNSSQSAQITDNGCGLSGAYYCPLFPGDEPMLAFLSATRQYLNSPAIRKCNTHRKQNNNGIYDYVENWCAQAFYKPSKQAVYDYYYALYYTQVANAEECVIKAMMPALYNATRHLQLNDS